MQVRVDGVKIKYDVIDTIERTFPCLYDHVDKLMKIFTDDIYKLYNACMK